MTRALDALAAKRRRLSMVRIDEEYVFEGPDGEPVTVACLLEGRRRPAVYHFMSAGDDDHGPCTGMGWTLPWYSSHGSDFNADLGVSTDCGETFGLSRERLPHVLHRRPRRRAPVGWTSTLLDLTPLGRSGDVGGLAGGLAADAAVPWWRLHDENATAVAA